ncbi:MAG: hypothetical protein V4812_08060 [Pseudomonadota bacterium]
MKQSDGFDARRLRPPGPAKWRWRWGTLLAALLVLLGTALAFAGAAALSGHPLTRLAEADGSLSAVLLGLGLVALGLGFWVWRSCRRRLRPSNGLCLAPHLLKKRD